MPGSTVMSGRDWLGAAFGGPLCPIRAQVWPLRPCQCARTTAAQPRIAGPRWMSEYVGNGPVMPVVGAEHWQSGGRLGTGGLQNRPHYLAERHCGVDLAVCD